ncbi:hypothetical protein JL100_023275 [Skermanella mucosa]|uniref:hypothetical protein n=1 Tax=Skermanella mucosa TaxID=1789672 RepID=UPI00192C6EF9|nr:hypothetical protein [Skermanella mucosa]UEM19971.1 hypothetical protein JL100_023275 [Skermanella mucosa]
MAKMFSPPKAPVVVTPATMAPAETVSPVLTVPAPTPVPVPAPVVSKPDPVPAKPIEEPAAKPAVVEAVTPAPTTPAPTTSTATQERADALAAAEKALARRDRSLTGTVLTSWRGVLQQAGTGAAPARKRLLGE